MTTDAFITALRNMSGLLPEMVEHLATLAPDMNDDERSSTIGKLQPMNSALIKNREEATEIAKKGDEAIQKIHKEDIPKARKAAENSEHEKEKGDIEDIFEHTD